MAKKTSWLDSANGQQPKIGDEIVVYYENTNGKSRKEVIVWTFHIAALVQKQKTKFKWILLPE